MPPGALMLTTAIPRSVTCLESETIRAPDPQRLSRGRSCLCGVDSALLGNPTAGHVLSKRGLPTPGLSQAALWG